MNRISFLSQLRGLLLFLLSVSFLTSCSSDPATPPLLQAGYPQFFPQSSHHALWGWAALECNALTGEVNVSPLRSTALHLNVAGPVMATHGISADIVESESDPPSGHFVIDISLTHPFTDKPKFSGFDVKGILITPGSLSLDSSISNYRLANLKETQLLNRDGITRWWNPTEFTGSGLLGYVPATPGTKNTSLLTATLNPYKTFADALEPLSPLQDFFLVPLDDDAGRAIFSSGATNTRRYDIQFPVSGGPVVIFNYAVDASWVAPSPNPPEQVPDDFPIEANQPEPFRVQLSFPTNTLEYLEGGKVSGKLSIQAAVSDWQGIASGNIHSQITSVTAVIPTLLISPVSLTFLYETPFEAVYEADLTPYLRTDLTSADPHLALVEVAVPDALYTQGGSTIAPSAPVCAFQTAIIEIPSVTCNPDSNDSFSDAEPLSFGEWASGTLCRPGGALIDYRDFFFFTVPSGGVFGSIELECDVEPVSLALYDPSYTQLKKVYVSQGFASIDLGPLSLSPGKHYIRVLTENEDQIAVYSIFNNGSKNPCGESLAFNFESQVDDPTSNKLSAGRHAIAQHGDDIWVIFTEGGKYDQSVKCAYSPFGGAVFLTPVEVDHASGTSALSASIARAPDGKLYAAWVDYRTGSGGIYVSSSSDKGATWSSEVNVYDFETAPLPEEAGPLGPIVSMDNSGRLHLVWVDQRDAIPHLYYSFSDDQGATWQPAEKIDDNTSYQVSPISERWDMAVDPYSGMVYVVWTDYRHTVEPPLSQLDLFIDRRDASSHFGTDIMVTPPPCGCRSKLSISRRGF